MPELPPRTEIVDAFWHVVAPAAGAAALVFALLLLRRTTRPAAGLLAAAAAVAVANHFRGVFPWLPDNRWWHVALPAIGGAFLVELLAQFARRPEFPYLLRGLIAGLTGAFIMPPAWQEESRLAGPAVGLLIGSLWAVQLAIGRADPGGIRPLVMSIICFGAAGVLAHNRSQGFADLLAALGFGLAVIAGLAWLTGTDASSAAAVAVVPVVVFLVVSRALYDSPIPLAAFVLVGVTAPLTRLPPRGGRLPHWPTLVLVAAQVAVAVGLAMRAAPLQFGDDW